jgi:hypothetical protein
MKPKGSRSGQKDSISPKMKHPRAKTCTHQNSFTNKALTLFSLFFGKPPKRVCSAKTQRTHFEGANLSIATYSRIEKPDTRHTNPEL